MKMEGPAVEEMELQSVTTTDSSGGTVTGTEGNTSVHQSVLSRFQEGDTNAVSNRDIVGSMERQGTELNLPDEQGYTEIGRALKQDDKTRVESMLRGPSSRRLHLDYYPGDSDLTVREILTQKYPDLESLLAAPLMESLDSSDRDIKLLAALQHDKYKVFLKYLSPTNPTPSYDEPYYSSLLEIACQMKSRGEFVKVLLDKGADVNIKNRVTGMPLLHATARSGNFDVLYLLLWRKEIDLNVKDNKDRTILHWWARVSEKNPDDKETLKNCSDLLYFEFISNNRSFKDKDSSGSTPFSTAVDRGYSDRVVRMLSGKFIEKTELVHIHEVLESTNESFVKSILDYCFESDGEQVKGKELKVKFKFTALANLTNYAEYSHQKKIFNHPVVSAFINVMWNRLKYIFFINVAFYVVFLAFLTAYILFSEFCNIQMNRDVANITNGLLSFNNNNLTCGMSDEWRYSTSQCLRYILMVLLGLLCFREGCQIYDDHMDYIRKKENWLEILLIIVTFTSCSGIVVSIEGNKHLFAFAILLGWLELVLLLGRLPLLSIQTEMLKKVSLTFLKYMAGYIVLILAFAISFYILFKENEKGDEVVLFANPFISLVKTIVMFAGEFDASDLPFDTLPGTSHLIFLLFVFFVAIVLLNLLNGLAVGDTRNVMERAKILSLEARVKLIDYLFRVYFKLPYKITRYKVMKQLVLFPTNPLVIKPTDLQYFQRIIKEKRERNKKQEETEYVENWKLFAEKQSTLQIQCEKMQQMLENIMTHLNIPET